MIGSYITAVIGSVSLMVGWVAIQSIWKKTFSDHVTDEDAMAERTKCTNCGCTSACENKKRQLST